MKQLYILLTRTTTILSRAIHAATGDGYTHVSIALDGELSQLYSFARKRDHMPLPAGLVHENLHTAVYARNGQSRCALYKIDVTDVQHEAVRARIEAMLAADTPYRYSLLGVMLCKLDLAHERQRHMFCSQFVASLLEEAGIATLPKPASLMHPVDFIGMPGLQRCYEGPLAACDCWWQGAPQIGLGKAGLSHVYSTGG